MKEKLVQLWLNEKESEVFLYLVEYGISAASEIATHIKFPKSTVNFLADSLWKQWVVKKSFRKKTGYYEADIPAFQENILSNISLKKDILQEIIPELKDKNRNVISKPKILFFDGEQACKQEYLKILQVQDKVFYEFGAHKDLTKAFGKDFMDVFISKRVEHNIFCDSIGSSGEVEENLKKSDNQHYRSLKIFEKDIWEIHSSISIYDDNVLILNLKDTCVGVKIQNIEFSETMKTIFLIAKKSKY